MSTETSAWLNQNVLIGFTEQRGNAWHHRAADQGDEPNHYTGAIPLEDVKRRLFNWQAISVPMWVDVPKEKRDDLGKMIAVPQRIAIVRDDTFEVLGVPSQSYQIHQYDDALLNRVSHLIDDDLQIGSAGLLKGGAIAWVQIEMRDNAQAADGIDYRPNLLCTTSMNGSIATTYKRTVTIVVCDNTRNIALAEDSPEFRVRHTANSTYKLQDARTALNIVHTLSDEFAAEVEKLLATKVSDKQYEQFLNVLLPINDDATAAAKSKRDNDYGQYMSLWKNDPRVTPWRNTGFGVAQAVNTYRQHIRPTRGNTIRVERNMMDSLTGVTENADKKALNQLFSLLS